MACGNSPTLYSALLQTLLFMSSGIVMSQQPNALNHISSQPADCVSLLDPGKLNDQNLDWRDTVALEHCDRVKRLWRLTEISERGSAPIFYDMMVDKAHLPTNIGVNVPVLRVVFAEKVFFDTASASLLPEARRVIAIVAESLRRDVADVTVFVAGHTDSRGGREYNQQLSERRANSVAEALLLTLREKSRFGHIWRVGFGKDFPVAPNDTGENMALNRRVEFMFAGREEAALYYLAQLQDQICSNVPAADRKHCLEAEDVQHNRSGYTATNIEVPTPPKPEAPAAPQTQAMAPDPVRQVVITPYLRHVDPITPIFRSNTTPLPTD